MKDPVESQVKYLLQLLIQEATNLGREQLTGGDDTGRAKFHTRKIDASYTQIMEIFATESFLNGMDSDEIDALADEMAASIQEYIQCSAPLFRR